MNQVPYEYTNIPIPGGGYVTGFEFHTGQKNILYIRTDIGGVYRFDFENNEWIALNEGATMLEPDELFPCAVATDSRYSDVLYTVSGTYQPEGELPVIKGKLGISKDGGRSFQYKEMPCFAHGNLSGRGTGKRLVVDEAAEHTLYYASQRDGLFRTTNSGDTWERLEVCGEYHMTFVWCASDGNTLIVGTAGVDTGKDTRGHSLYVSYDSGAHFEPLMMPENPKVGEQSAWNGYVAHRYEYDGRYFYCTMNITGPHKWVVDMGYSCDCGHVFAGRIVRYRFGDNGRITGFDDITPLLQANDDGICEVGKQEIFNYGFGGISSCNARKGLLVASTFCRQGYRDMIYMSKDYGNTWEVILYDLSIGNMSFSTPYMKPEYNGGRSLIHWLSDIIINPFEPEEVWFNTGTGVFRGYNITKDERYFMDENRGLNQTVHINVYSPVDGPVRVLDMVGDLGGFAFDRIDEPCENTFADAKGRRYITCMNADYSDVMPNEVIVTARGNWGGTTKGGLIWSHDYGRTFERIPFTYGISEYLDERFRRIESPNTNAGWVAISADTRSIVYCVAENCDLFMKGIITSNDSGQTFFKTKITDLLGRDVSESGLHMKVFSDRRNAGIFYGFGDDFTLYVSMDAGMHFNQIEMPVTLPGLCTGLIDCANRTEIRGENGKSGVFYAALHDYGLWKLWIDAAAKKVTLKRIGSDKDAFYCVGLGLISEDSNYMKDNKAIYVCASLDGEYGFYRSFDDGNAFERISNDEQNFGLIQSIDGDSRVYGRFVIATGSFGLKIGKPC